MYYVYILRCADGTLYTGIATDPRRRLEEHNGKGSRGARYTAARRPVTLCASFPVGSRAEASRLEWRIKGLTRQEKEELLTRGRWEDQIPAEAIYGKDGGTVKNFGFGIMRLPVIGGENGVIDLETTRRMIDRFMAEGFCYFDTAHGYHNGQSEQVIRDLVAARYPRDSFLVANKLTDVYFHSPEDIRAVFARQLELTGVEYFDYYLMHAVSSSNYGQFVSCRAFETAKELKAQGKIRHIGISYHDQAPLLERVLTEHPEIEVVQIQLNYVDYDDANIQSGAVYEVCRKFGKPVIVMEPCKGGALADLPPEARAVFEPLGGSPASYAIRYAASFEGVFMVLSGMGSPEQVEDNLSFMKAFQPLTGEEREAIEKVRVILKGQNAIGCTGCRYCVAGCPRQIPIPALFSAYNSKMRYDDWQSVWYAKFSTAGLGKAGDCIECTACEHICPQHLPITALLRDVAARLEKSE